jgi:hypothetical protein
MQCRGLAIGIAGAIRMTDTISPTGAAMCQMTCIALEMETAVENITKRRAEAERRRAELRVAEFVAPWWRRWFRWGCR